MGREERAAAAAEEQREIVSNARAQAEEVAAQGRASLQQQVEATGREVARRHLTLTLTPALTLARFDINFDLNSDGLADRGETQAFFARVRSR